MKKWKSHKEKYVCAKSKMHLRNIMYTFFKFEFLLFIPYGYGVRHGKKLEIHVVCFNIDVW